MGAMPEGGCHGTNEWVDGFETDHCPVMTVNEAGELFLAYTWAERGFLPSAGGWADQPYALMEGINIVYQEVAHEEARRNAAANDRNRAR